MADTRFIFEKLAYQIPDLRVVIHHQEATAGRREACQGPSVMAQLAIKPDKEVKWRV